MNLHPAYAINGQPVLGTYGRTDPHALALVRSEGRDTSAYVEVSRLPEDARAAVYIEVGFADESELEAVYDALRKALNAVGLEPERSWAGFTEKDMEAMKRLRHFTAGGELAKLVPSFPCVTCPVQS